MRNSEVGPTYTLTRNIFLKSLSFLYLMGFLILANQGKALLSSKGLLPFALRVGPEHLGLETFLQMFFRHPTLFWLNSSDGFFYFLIGVGLLASAFGLIGHRKSLVNICLFATLWLTYLSFVNVGQIFYGYGWESILLETGFLAIFLSFRTPPVIAIWMVRWILFRVMFGAGLIKLRGDSCWLDLTCMQFHYETQPIPNPLSWYFHHLPVWMHKASVLYTHFVEVVLPWGYFGPRKLRYLGGISVILFQSLLILSGNLSWLNYMTIVLAFCCFDDQFWERVLPKKLLPTHTMAPAEADTLGRRLVLTCLAVLILTRSVEPALNLFSPRQIMNTNYDPFHLVNTYGAFGSISKKRFEVILKGSTDENLGPQSKWKEFEFKCKPGSLNRMPCIASPYHYRIDWQMWFAGMSGPQYHPWIFPLIGHLLLGDPDTGSLLAENPFSESPPRWIRADLYKYQFSSKPGQWWEREFIQEYLPPISLEDRRIQQSLKGY